MSPNQNTLQSKTPCSIICSKTSLRRAISHMFNIMSKKKKTCVSLWHSNKCEPCDLSLNKYSYERLSLYKCNISLLIYMTT